MEPMSIVARDLLDGYAVTPGAVDEAVGPDGAISAHWRAVVAALRAMGPAELERRAREVQRLLRNDGVTYTVYGGGAGPVHGDELPPEPGSWLLDPIPHLVASEEWARIEQGVAERAELLDVVLGDLYGPRELLRRGLLPAEVVFAHRGFLRPLDRVGPDGRPSLLSTATDLVRDPTGAVRVIADFTQAPSGAGYALENRSVVSRVFPSLYRDAQVHRLAPFFRQLRAAVGAAAPRGVEDPRVVLLTPGPLNETYFEHAFLATHLGYPLVEGNDLTVRDGRLWLRSLSGLEPVDVVLRRVDGWYCDPLELKPDSRLGVPGLVEACRRGTVTVLNPIGAAVLENPGLTAFLPVLARHLLGRDLLLTDAETWWCGDDRARSHVLANLAELVIKPIARRPGRNVVFGGELSSSQLDDLRRFIEARPHLFVGQEVVCPSSVPTLTADGVAPRHLVLRAFTVARDDSYLVMPGGLARVGPTEGTLVVSNQAGAISKDVWVLASEPEGQSGFWLHRGPLEASDPAGDLPSRTAENLFWLGRYAERAEATVRLLRAVLDRRTEFDTGVNPAGTEVLHGLLAALTHLTGRYPGFVGDGATDRLADPEPELLGTIVDAERPGSLAFSLRALLDAANAARDQLSGDTWAVLGNVERELVPLSQPLRDLQSAVQTALTGVLRSLLALAGLANESMVRDPGWAFMDAGRRIERAQLLARLLRATLVPVRGTAADSLMFESVLVTTESIITYRRRYRSHAQAAAILDLLVLDDGNPRSLAHQLSRLEEDLAAFVPTRTGLTDERRRLLEVATAVRVADTEHLALVDGDHRPGLALFLDDVVARLGAVAETIEASHFTHLSPQVLVGVPAPVPEDRGGLPV